MQIIHHLTIDLARQLPVPPIGAVQNDANSRSVEISLLENGEPWNVPDGVTAAVAFRKPDRTKGLYDRLPDGSAAVAVNGSAVIAILAPQVLSCAGDTYAAVVFHDADLNQLATFPFTLRVAANPAAGQGVSSDYYRYATMEAVSDAVDGFITKAEKTLCVNAPAIVCDGFGESVTVTDAADRPLCGLTLYGKTVQNGTPTPDNPVAPESAGAGGAITVTVGQTALTVSTPGGLHGFPIRKGLATRILADGTGVRECEIDFAAGVMRKAVEKFVFDGSEPWKFNANYNLFTLSSAYYTPFQKIAVTQNDGSNFLGFCSHLKKTDYVSGANMVSGTCDSFTGADGKTIKFKYDAFASLDEWKAFLAQQFAAGTPLTVLTACEAEETALSAGELAAYAALHSNKPNTTAFNDSGAEMKLSYAADTKLYIDQKLAAISTAILS